MRHRRATINESFGAWEFLYINSGCPVRGEELVHFQFYCEDFHSKNEKSGKINSENRGGYEKIQAVFVDDGGCAGIFPVQQCLCCRRDG